MKTADRQPPFRAEVIGSLLRPRALKDAGRALQEGRLPPAEYEALLEREIARVIARQEDIGLQVVTDGELARSSWFGFFFEGLDGFRLAPSHFKFKDAEGQAFEWPTCVAEARIRRHAPITLREFERASRHARRAVVKATMPAPSAFHFFRLGQAVDAVRLPRRVRLLRRPGRGLSRRAGRSWPRPAAATCSSTRCPSPCCATPTCAARPRRKAAIPRPCSIPISGCLQRIVADRPAGMTFGLHLCRGNFRGRWMAAGGYEPVAEKLFNRTPVDVFFLEYDSERAGDFPPLRFVPKDKRVVLGLVSSKIAPAGRSGRPVAPHRGGSRVLPLDQLGALHPMRLCQRRRRQRADRGRAMGQARADRGNRRPRLGQ